MTRPYKKRSNVDTVRTDRPRDGEVLPVPSRYDTVTTEEIEDPNAPRKSLTEQLAAQRLARQRRFLVAYAETGLIKNACEIAMVPRRTIYMWLEKDPEEFGRAFDHARDVATDRVEEEVRRRAVEGVAEPVFYQGRVCGHVQKYSDLLALAILNAYRPEKFKNRQEHTGKDGGPIAVVHVSYDHNMKPDDMPD